MVRWDHMPERKKRILVTGASGLLGGNLIRLFPESWEIIGVTHHHGIQAPSSHVRAVQMNILDEGIESTFDALGPLDAIVHTAALTSVDRCEEQKRLAWFLNAVCSQKIATYCANKGIHLIHISTDHVFDGISGNYAEDSTPHPINYYAETKLAAEEFLQQAKGQTAIIRTNFFGFNMQQKEDLAGWILHALENKQQIPLFTDVLFSPMLVNDLALFIIDIITDHMTGMFHIASSDHCSKYDFGIKIAHAFGYDTSLLQQQEFKDSHLWVPRPMNMSLGSAQTQAGFHRRFPTVEESIARYKTLFDEGYPATLKCLAAT